MAVPNATGTAGPRGVTEKFERLVSWLVAKAMIWLAYRAAKREDWHRFNHLSAAISVGNSFHREGDGVECTFPPELHQRAVTWAGVKAFKA